MRSALLENLGLKLLSFTFALGLYAFIHEAENAQRTFSLSVVSSGHGRDRPRAGDADLRSQGRGHRSAAREDPAAHALGEAQPGSAFLGVLVEVTLATAEVNPPKVFVRW